MTYWNDERKNEYREQTGCACPVWAWSQHQVVLCDSKDYPKHGGFRGCRVHTIYAAYWEQFARI